MDKAILIAGVKSEALDEIRAVMDGYIKERKVASIAVAVVRNGETAMFDTFGTLDLQSDVPVEKDSIFRIYSMTKPITGVALMTLYEEGKFDLDDPVTKYLPEFEGQEVCIGENEDGSPKTEPCTNPMTVRHLMSHTAGLSYGWIPDSPVDKLYQKHQVTDYGNTLEELTKRAAKIPLRYQPGSDWQYSIAVDVQARLIEVLTGEVYRDHLKRTVLDPLGMVDTDFFVPEEKRHRFTSNFGPNADTDVPLSALSVRGESMGEGEIERVDRPGHGSIYDSLPALTMGGGGLVSTPIDYLRFAAMLTGGGELDGTHILKPETIALMTRNHIDESIIPINLIAFDMPETGFGLDFSVRMSDDIDWWPGLTGEYGWTGAASTHFFVAPSKNLVGLLMTQFMTAYTYPIEMEFKKILYEGLID